MSRRWWTTPGAEVFILGGKLFKHSAVACGSVAAEAARQISADTFFLGVTGVHPDVGLTTGDADEAAMKRVLSGRAAETYVLASAEKMGAASPYQVIPFSEVSGIITDAPPGSAVVRNFATAASRSSRLVSGNLLPLPVRMLYNERVIIVRMYSKCMPSIQHEGLVELIRQYPPLGVELLRHVGVFALPAGVTAVLGSEDMSDVTPRSNGRRGRQPRPQKYTADSVVVVADAISGERLMAIVVEPQGQAADDKNQSWPVYATTARKANRCPRAVLLVVCWDPAEADKCRRIIATGHPGLVFIPIVIDPGNAPALTDASPYLVLFNAVIGAVDLDTQEGCTQVVSAIGSTGTTGSYFRSLCDIILGVASDAAHEHLEELMGITYKSKFVDGFYQQGRAEGEAVGEARGEAAGEARARATDILRILKSRALHPTRAQRELIESCQDLGQLDAWFDRALAVTTVAAVFED